MIKRFLMNAFRAFFTEQSTFYSVYVITENGLKPLCQWYRGFNPPRVGEYLAVEKKETVELTKDQKEFLYYQVVSVSHIMYGAKFNSKGAERTKKEATIIVRYKKSKDIREL